MWGSFVMNKKVATSVLFVYYPIQDQHFKHYYVATGDLPFQGK